MNPKLAPCLASIVTSTIAEYCSLFHNAISMAMGLPVPFYSVTSRFSRRKFHRSGSILFWLKYSAELFIILSLYLSESKIL